MKRDHQEGMRLLPEYTFNPRPVPRNFFKIGYQITRTQLQGTVESSCQTDRTQVLTTILWWGRMDQFSFQVLMDALRFVLHKDPPMRFPAFASAGRKLFRLTFQKLAARMKRRRRQRTGYPDGEEQPDVFVASSGLSLGYPYEELFAAIAEMSSVTHLRPFINLNTTESPEADRFMHEALSGLHVLFAMVDSFLEQTLAVIEPLTSRQALHALIMETRREVIGLAACHGATDAYLEKLTVTKLGKESASLEVEVFLDVVRSSEYRCKSVD